LKENKKKRISKKGNFSMSEKKGIKPTSAFVIEFWELLLIEN
jgi:hypothetical protein